MNITTALRNMTKRIEDRLGYEPVDNDYLRQIVLEVEELREQRRTTDFILECHRQRIEELEEIIYNLNDPY